jgi:hypothetical protein
MVKAQMLMGWVYMLGNVGWYYPTGEDGGKFLQDVGET